MARDVLRNLPGDRWLQLAERNGKRPLSA